MHFKTSAIPLDVFAEPTGQDFSYFTSLVTATVREKTKSKQQTLEQSTHY